MKSTIVTLLVALGLFAGAVSAEAQPLGTWYKNAPKARTEAIGAGTPEIATGYNYFHASNCVVFSHGAGAGVCIVSADNIVACTDNPATQNGMLAACQTGNIVAIYIPDAASGAFTQFITYTSK